MSCLLKNAGVKRNFENSADSTPRALVSPFPYSGIGQRKQ
jgi:hypothetical protein